MEALNRACNLECLNDAKVHEFVGPVKIILVDPPKEDYDRKKTESAFIAIGNLMMGATVMVVMLLTLTFILPLYDNLHIYLCTIGYQLCMPSAILMMNGLFGAAATLNKSDRKCQHIFLQIFAMLCFLTGSYMAVCKEPKFKGKKTLHYRCGCIAGAFAIMASIMGSVTFIKKLKLPAVNILRNIHRAFGIISFLSSSICFILGIARPVNVLWVLGTGTPLIFVLFCVFYTSTVLYTPIMNLIPKKKQ